jgi:hypothetical protein
MGQLRRQRTAREPRGRISITPRVVAILQTVADCRLLSSTDLAATHFRSKSHADRVLRKMFDHGLLGRIERPVVHGSAELLYTLGRRGREMLSLSTDPVPPRLARRTPRQLDHLLGLGRLRLLMTQPDSAQLGYHIDSWDWTPTVLQPGSPEQPRGLVPDCAFTLRTPRGPKAALCFVEYDLATEGRAVFLRKLRAYEAAWRAGKIVEIFGVEKFRVLTLCPNERRRDGLKSVASEVEPSWAYWFAAVTDLAANGLTGPVWLLGPGAVAGLSI